MTSQPDPSWFDGQLQVTQRASLTRWIAREFSDAFGSTIKASYDAARGTEQRALHQSATLEDYLRQLSSDVQRVKSTSQKQRAQLRAYHQGA